MFERFVNMFGGTNAFRYRLKPVLREDAEGYYFDGGGDSVAQFAVED
jgi:hypothetical protein